MSNHRVILLNSTARLAAYIVLHLSLIIWIYHLFRSSLNKSVPVVPVVPVRLKVVFLFSINHITNIDSVAI